MDVSKIGVVRCNHYQQQLS